MTGPRSFRALALGVLLLLGCGLGCGPVEYLSQVSSRAATALAHAQRAEADRLAPYEYARATEYYRKAREAGGEAAFQIAIEYGRLTEEFAVQARALARDRSEKARPSGGEQAR